MGGRVVGGAEGGGLDGYAGSSGRAWRAAAQECTADFRPTRAARCASPLRYAPRGVSQPQRGAALRAGGGRPYLCDLSALHREAIGAFSGASTNGHRGMSAANLPPTPSRRLGTPKPTIGVTSTVFSGTIGFRSTLYAYPAGPSTIERYYLPITNYRNFPRLHVSPQTRCPRLHAHCQPGCLFGLWAVGAR